MNLTSISYGSSRDERQWQGTPSQRLLDAIEKKQDTENGEFFQILKAAIVEVDRKRNKVWFVNKNSEARNG
jgi:hypothetical protein